MPASAAARPAGALPVGRIVSLEAFLMGPPAVMESKITIRFILAYLDGCRQCPMQAEQSATPRPVLSALLAAERRIQSTLDIPQGNVCV